MARGLWLREEQRPLQLVPSLAPLASPWHDPDASEPCRALLRAFETIRAEAVALGDGLGDGSAISQACDHLSLGRLALSQAVGTCSSHVSQLALFALRFAQRGPSIIPRIEPPLAIAPPDRFIF